MGRDFGGINSWLVMFLTVDQINDSQVVEYPEKSSLPQGVRDLRNANVGAPFNALIVTEWGKAPIRMKALFINRRAHQNAAF